jgi:FkbM family methyltransferase
MLQNEKLVKNVFGQWIYVDPNDFIGSRIIKKGLYDRPSVYFIRSLLQKMNAPIILDIGANIGNHLIPTLPFVERAIAFEPQPEIFNALKRSVGKNNYANCTIQNYGLGCENNKIEFYQNLDGNNGASSFVKVHGQTSKTNTLYLEIKNGDEALEDMSIQRLDFIKLDVESFEFEVLKGIQNNIKKHSPIILMEWLSRTTGQDFIKKNIFNNILSDYKILALVGSYDKTWWKENGGRFWPIKRIFSELNRKNLKRWRLIKFNPSKDYGNVLLFKKEHETLINKMM